MKGYLLDTATRLWSAAVRQGAPQEHPELLRRFLETSLTPAAPE